MDVLGFIAGACSGDNCTYSRTLLYSDPAPQDIGTDRSEGDSIDIIWSNPPSCYPYTAFYIHYEHDGTQYSAHISQVTTRYTLTNLEPDAQFTLYMVAEFEDGTQSTSGTVEFSTQPVEKSLTAGEIVGIAIGMSSYRKTIIKKCELKS